MKGLLRGKGSSIKQARLTSIRSSKHGLHHHHLQETISHQCLHHGHNKTSWLQSHHHHITATISICINWTNHHRGSTISSIHHQGHQRIKQSSCASTGPLGSTIKCKGSKAITKGYIIMGSTNIIIKVASSYCDHCKGHTSSSSSVVGIKDNLQSGVGINDNLQQQSPPLSLMTTTHAPPKSMLPSESLSPFGINSKG